MTDLQLAVVLMCLMGVTFALGIKLMFDAFLIHLEKQSELTSRAVKQSGEAIALNNRLSTTLDALVAQRIEQPPSKRQVAGSNPAERPTPPQEQR